MRDKVTYFFLDGRVDRINSDNSFPEEMFYGYKYLKNNYKNVTIIEAKKSRARLFFKILLKIELATLFKFHYFSHTIFL